MTKLALFLALVLTGAAHAETVATTPFGGNVRPVTTIGSLPSCSSSLQGVSYFVTDALTPVALSTVVAGGAVKVPVICNGTNWIVG